MSVAKRRNRINGQFAARLIEMLESPAYRALSASGHAAISRIENSGDVMWAMGLSWPQTVGGMLD